MKLFGVGARVIAVSYLALCAACGGGGESGGGGGNSPPPLPPPPPITGIGPSGGTVTEASGAKVVIPAGALAAQTDIAVTQLSAGAPPLPAGVTAFGPIYAFTPHGTAFASSVTITVPFDPTKVPAGMTLALYKTNATLSVWEVVAGATVSGSTMVGNVTGFSDAVVASVPTTSQITPIQKSWQVDLYNARGNYQRIVDLNGTGAVDDFGTLGRQVIDNLDTYFIHSTESGQTFWSQSVSPEGPEYIGARSALTQTYYFRVDQEPPTLSFQITKASLTAFDGGGILPHQELCPWLPANATDQQVKDTCDGHITNGEASFRIVARGLTAQPFYYSAGGAVEVTGIRLDWRPLVTGDLSEHALFRESDFVFNNDAEGNGTGRYFTALLLQPKPVPVPIGTLHKNDIFSVQIFLKTTAINHIRNGNDVGVSYVSALIRDPLQDAGIDLLTSGLTQIPPQDGIPTTAPTLSCTTGPNPAAGVLRFSRARFSEAESGDRAVIVVERIVGSTGAVGVRVQTHDGSAIAGSDYQAVTAEVRFADGEDGQRRIEVPLLNDELAEDEETVNLTLSDIGGCAQLDATPGAVLTVLDDDRPVPVTPKFNLGGSVSGLAGSGLLLQTDRFDQVQPSANGTFSFPVPLDDRTPYTVSVAVNPANPIQNCSVTNGSGTIAGADVTNIQVTCTTPAPTGGLDPAFGSLGKVFSILGSAHVLARQADGKLLALGGLTLTRFNADGTIDTSFGIGGKVDIVANGNAVDQMKAIAVQADGKIVVAGFTSFPTIPNDDFAVQRFNTDGRLDMSFGTGGKVVTEFDGHFDQASSVLLQRDGKILVAGNAQVIGTVGLEQDFAVVRYLADGTLDPSFGIGGKATTGVSGVGYVNAAALQIDGAIVVVGRVTVSGGRGNPDMVVARFGSNGLVDTGFGIDHGVLRIDFREGIVPVNFDGGDVDVANDVAIHPGDDKIVVAGYTFTGGLARIPRAALAVLSRFGTLDTMHISSVTDAANGIALQADGKIVIAGSSNSDFALERFASDGLPDATFDRDGLFTVDFFGDDDEAFDVLIQPDGNIVASGVARNGTGGGIGIVRVRP